MNIWLTLVNVTVLSRRCLIMPFVCMINPPMNISAQLLTTGLFMFRSVQINMPPKILCPMQANHRQVYRARLSEPFKFLHSPLSNSITILVHPEIFMHYQLILKWIFLVQQQNNSKNSIYFVKNSCIIIGGSKLTCPATVLVHHPLPDYLNLYQYYQK